MAAVPMVLFSLGQESYAIPAHQVRKIVRSKTITSFPPAHAFMEGVLDLRGRMLAVIDLKKRFGLGVTLPPAPIIIVRIPNALVGLIVDRVDNVISIPEELIQEAPLQAASSLDPNFFLGIFQTEKKLVLVLNITTIFSMKETEQLAGFLMRLPT